jgi:hypothetical protein
VETELNFNNNRNYDPTTGRYVQSDPIGLDGGMSTYGYAFSAPQNEIDPPGLRPPTPSEIAFLKSFFWKMLQCTANGYKQEIIR